MRLLPRMLRLQLCGTRRVPRRCDHRYARNYGFAVSITNAEARFFLEGKSLHLAGILILGLRVQKLLKRYTAQRLLFGVNHVEVKHFKPRATMKGQSYMVFASGLQ